MNIALKRDSAYFDLPRFRQELSDPENPLRFRFYVEGLSCGRCVEKIESLNGKVNQISAIRVNLPKQNLEVQLQSEQASLSELVDRVEGLGFKLYPFVQEQELETKATSEDKSEIRRLAVAAICASNIMMFSFAIYFGATAEFKTLFQWLSFAIYLPVVSYVALPFYRRTWTDLINKKISIDGPLAVASLFGFLFSAVNLVRNQGEIYFDSLAGFIFLILLSRFLQKRMQRKFLSYRTQLGVNTSFKSRKISGNDWAWIPSGDLIAQQEILVKKGEMIPADSEVTSDFIKVDASYLTGESKPVLRYAGMQAQAGTILLSNEARLKVLKSAADSDFGKLINQVRDGALQKTSVQNVSDRYATGLLLVVFSLAILNVVFNLAGDLSQSIERSLALIVLACPCAMAFGTPLALSFSLSRAFRSGFLIKSADSLLRVSQIKNVFLDKTGTVTGQLQVSAIEPRVIPKEWAEIALGLEQNSMHPIAEAIRKFLQPLGYRPQAVAEVQNVPGAVAGFVNNKLYTLQGSEKLTGRKSVGLFLRGEALMHFLLVDPVMYAAQSLIRKLKLRHLNLFILSGDTKEEVQKINKDLGLSFEALFAQVSAADKAQIVARFPNSMMVGDGMNDSLAFKAADVGVAVNGSVQMAMQSADIFMLTQDVERLDDLFLVSKRAHKLIRRNLIISFIYNSLGAVAALCGFINPFVAAVLMPISSGFILLATWVGSRK